MTGHQDGQDEGPSSGEQGTPRREQGGQVSAVASLSDPDQPIQDSQSVAGDEDGQGAPDVEAGPDAVPESNRRRNRE